MLKLQSKHSAFTSMMNVCGHEFVSLWVPCGYPENQHLLRGCAIHRDPLTRLGTYSASLWGG